MTNLTNKVINIENKYENMLDSFEKNIGMHNIFNLYNKMNSSFNKQSHGREWRNFRKIYRYDFPPLDNNVNELISLFDTYYTAFIKECLFSLKKLSNGKKVTDMKAEALHIQAWDIALCSINKKVTGGLDDYISNIEIQLYKLLQKYIINELTITKYFSTILTVLPYPLISFEDLLKDEYKSFFDEYSVTDNSYFKMEELNYKKYKHILRTSLYNEILFNNQLSLIYNTKGNYFSQHVLLEDRRLTRTKKLEEINQLITDNKDLAQFNELINQHDALTFLNVNLESQFGFKSIIGLIGIYIIKEQS